jgi:MinD-like ATPase involved in chromosome partitioning or flagellar assembly
MGLARELSRYHDKKILYLSFEELPATELYITFGSGCRKISEFLYYLFEKKDDEICSHLEGFTTTDHFGVGFFCPSRGRNDLRSLTKDDLAYFVKYLTDSCRYDYILIDFNHDLSPETWQMLTYCTRLVMVHKNDPVSIQKHRKLADFLRKGAVPIAEETLINVRNFNDGGSQIHETIRNRTGQGNFENESEYVDGNDSSCIQNLIVIDADENSFSYHGEQLNIDISQTFGIGIKHLAETVLLAEFN